MRTIRANRARSRKKLARLARDAGASARAGTPHEAARDAHVLLLAVHWSRVDDVLQQAGDLSGRILVTCSLPMNEDDTALVVAHTSSGAEELARKAPDAEVAARLIRDVGFDPVDAGPLRIARHIEPFTLLMAQLAYEVEDSPAIAYRFERFKEIR